MVPVATGNITGFVLCIDKWCVTLSSPADTSILPFAALNKKIFAYETHPSGIALVFGYTLHKIYTNKLKTGIFLK